MPLERQQGRDALVSPPLFDLVSFACESPSPANEFCYVPSYPAFCQWSVVLVISAVPWSVPFCVLSCDCLCESL